MLLFHIAVLDSLLLILVDDRLLTMYKYFTLACYLLMLSMSININAVNSLRVLSAYLIHRYQLLDYADCSIIANSHTTDKCTIMGTSEVLLQVLIL